MEGINIFQFKEQIYKWTISCQPVSRPEQPDARQSPSTSSWNVSTKKVNKAYSYDYESKIINVI